MNGGELARELRSRMPALRVLFLSGHTEDEVLRRGIRDGRDAFLHEPFTPDDLEQKIRAALHDGG